MQIPAWFALLYRCLHRARGYIRNYYILKWGIEHSLQQKRSVQGQWPMGFAATRSDRCFLSASSAPLADKTYSCAYHENPQAHLYSSALGIQQKTHLQSFCQATILTCLGPRMVSLTWKFSTLPTETEKWSVEIIWFIALYIKCASRFLGHESRSWRPCSEQTEVILQLLKNCDLVFDILFFKRPRILEILAFRHDFIKRFHPQVLIFSFIVRWAKRKTF